MAERLAEVVKPAGQLILVPMGPVCPWEVKWHLLHGKVGGAVRRWRQPAGFTVNGQTIPIWYPSARRLKRDFAPHFRLVHTESLGLWLPPSYLGHLVDRWPGLFDKLAWLEEKTGRLTGGWGDHYIAVFERNKTTEARRTQRVHGGFREGIARTLCEL